MRIFVTSVIFLVGLQAFAGNLETKITSFNYTGSNLWTAEICGKVTGTGAENAFVTLTVDANAKKPAKYTTIADENGDFCSVVVSYYGTASAVARTK